MSVEKIIDTDKKLTVGQLDSGRKVGLETTIRLNGDVRVLIRIGEHDSTPLIHVHAHGEDSEALAWAVRQLAANLTEAGL